jgi:hypothetical protein
MIVDSSKQQLEPGNIIPIWLENNPQKHPPEVVIPAIVNELSQPDVTVIQYGNTLFEVIHKGGDAGFFKAFNVDTGQNFLRHSMEFVVYAKNELGLNTLVTQFDDPAIEKLFYIISKNPPMPGMGFKTMKDKSGQTRIILNLGA